MIWMIVAASLLAILGIVILSGRGDKLIAGYNTAPKEEKAKYDVKRLRLIFGSLFLLMAPACFIFRVKDPLSAQFSFGSLVILLCVVAVILGNTWAKKKRR